MQVLTFFCFWRTVHVSFCIRFVLIVVGNESKDNSYVAHDRGSQNRRFAKRGPRNSRFATEESAKQQVRKKGSAEQNVWEPRL